MKILKKRVSEVASAKGITLQNLAKEIGITYQTLYTTLTLNPKISSIQRIANALGVDVIELLTENRPDEAIIKCPHCGKSIRLKVEQVDYSFTTKHSER